MPREFTYAGAGVNRGLRVRAKGALRFLQRTYCFSRYGKVVQLPYGMIFPFHDGFYLDFVIEGVGTKVLVAQLAEKYDTIGVDGVAMAVNDVIRSGARPLAVVDNIHAQVSDPGLIREWMKGIVKGAVEAECVVPGGEIGDVSELIRGFAEGKGFDMVFATVGEVSADKIIYGRDLKAGDIVVGLRSSGIHSNGVTLARKVLFKFWGGRYDPFDVPEPLERELVYEVLEPTRIYVKPSLRVADEVKVKAAVHITGDAYLKFDRLMLFSRSIGFEFDNFKPQPIFDVIQRAASELGGKITDEEMFKTFNMGWGFAIVIDKQDVDRAVDVLEKSGVRAETIGRVTSTRGIRIFYKGKKMFLRR
ncbi:MAG: phosphoribosylformylglycinamidine cyclo-ligase [Candidatus Bathyarchaeia archaeon]